jgi:hypothetical protein
MFGFGCVLFLAPQSLGGWQVIFKWLGVLTGIGCVFLSLSPMDFALQSKSMLMNAGFSIFLYPFHQVSLRKKDEPKASITFNECLMAVASILGAAFYSIYLIHVKQFLIFSVFIRTISLPDWFRDLSGI